MTLRAERLGYISLNVKDVDYSTEFYTRACHLEVVENIGGRVYLRGSLQHHWLVIQQSSNPGIERIGIEVKDRETLDAFEQRLREYGLPVEAGDGLETDRVMRYVRFYDPSGNPLELYCDMLEMPVEPAPQRVSFLNLQHVVINVSNLKEGQEFYTNVLGMRVSDYLEQTTAFLHFRDGWHHGIGLGVGKAPSGLNHICFQPPDLDMTMRAHAALKRLNVKITKELLKHSTSGSVGFYFQGPDCILEFSFGARNFSEDEVFKPRVVAKGPDGSASVWPLGFEDLEPLRVLDEAALQSV